MNAIRIVLPLAALLIAGPAFAQPGHDEHHPAAAASAAKPDQMAMHEHCKAMMGAKMAGAAAHNHSQDKQGMMSGAKGKPPTKAEMERMHAQCAKMMAEAPAAPAKK